MAKTKTNKDGYLVFEDSDNLVHRWVAEKKHPGINLKLNEDLEVHHINSNKKDNDKQNLIILKRDDHYDLHQYENKRNLISTMIITFCFIYFGSLILVNVYQLKGFVQVLWLSVLFILILTIELKTNFIGQTIKRPNEKLFDKNKPKNEK